MFASSARPSLYRTSHPAGQHGTLAAVALFGVTLAAAGGIGYAVWANQPPELDTAGCAINMAGPSSLAAIIDLTDPIPVNERGAVQTELDRRAAALGVGAHFSIIGLAPTAEGKLTTALFNRCKPKDGFQVSKWNGNKDMQAETYKSEFAQPLQEAIGHLDGQPSKASPIIEGLAAVATDVAFAKSDQRSLVLVSDLLENSAIANMYRAGYSFAAVERKGFKAVRELKGKLAGTDVLILQIRAKEAGPYQTQANREFWLALMDYAGANKDDLRFERL